MARSKQASSNHSRRLLIAIPIIALVGLAGAYALSLTPVNPCPSAKGVSLAENFIFELSIQVTNGTQVQFIVPPALGEAQACGGSSAIWADSTFNGYGIDNLHYPVYTDAPAEPYPGFSVVHVASKVAQSYTMGDLFNVWGEPLGADRTLNLAAQQPYAWDMCVGTSQSNLQPGNWTAQQLEPSVNIVLRYSDARGCNLSGSS